MYDRKNEVILTMICDCLKIINADGAAEDKELSKLISFVDIWTLGENSRELVAYVIDHDGEITPDYTGVNVEAYIDTAYRILVSASKISSKSIFEFTKIAQRLNASENLINDYLSNIDLRINSKMPKNGLKLVTEVKKISTNKIGAFARAYEDLARLREEYASVDLSTTDYETKMIMMAYAYALRTSAAGLLGQGIWGWEELIAAIQEFQRFQHLTIHTKDFQETAADQAQELWESYDERLKRDVLSRLTVPFLIAKPYSIPIARDMGFSYDLNEIIEE